MIPSATVYINELCRYGHGIPLWTPEPSDGGDEVRIGDVGDIDDDGQFHRLFNVTVEAEHPINGGEVPRDFQPLNLPTPLISIKPNQFAPGPITSKGVRTNEFQVQGSA